MRKCADDKASVSLRDSVTGHTDNWWIDGALYVQMGLVVGSAERRAGVVYFWKEVVRFERL